MVGNLLLAVADNPKIVKPIQLTGLYDKVHQKVVFGNKDVVSLQTL